MTTISGPSLEVRGSDGLEPPDDGARPGWQAAPRRLASRLARHPDLLVLACFALLGFIANLPAWPGDPSRIATCACGGYQDLNQSAWFLAWTPYALLHGHNPLVTTWINYPFGINLAQNTGMPLLGILAAPLTLAVSPVSSENLLRFLAFPLSAYAAYWVLRRFVGYRPAAFAGALLYGFSPYMVNQAAVHLNLSFVPLPPLILYGCYELCVRQQRSAVRVGLLTGLAAVAQFFISAEVLATTALVVAIGLFYLLFLCIRDVPSHAKHALVGLLVGGAVVAVFLAYPLYVMGHGAQHYVGPAQGFNQVYNADLLSGILPTKAQLVAPHRLAMIGSRFVGGLANLDENGSYLGIPLLALCAYFLVRFWRRLWILFAALMAGTIFLLSLGPQLYINGHPYDPGVNMPFRKINHLPFLENILPSRFSLYVAFFTAVILAIGITALHEERLRAGAQSSRPRSALAGRVVLAGLGLASLVVLIPRWPYRSLHAQPHWVESAAGLRAIPTGALVLTYPYATPFSDDAMLWQALSGMRFKIFGSYALNRARTGRATTFPNVLQPSDVESLLANSMAPIPVPGIPDVAATSASLEGERLLLLGHHRPPVGATLVGKVINVDYRHGGILVVGSHGRVTSVSTGPTTRFVEPGILKPGLRGIIPGMHIACWGRVGPGSITPQRVADLRTFIQSHHVDAVLVELGRRDSAVVSDWVTRALGPATRAGGGGELWLDLNRNHAD